VVIVVQILIIFLKQERRQQCTTCLIAVKWAAFTVFDPVFVRIVLLFPTYKQSIAHRRIASTVIQFVSVIANVIPMALCHALHQTVSILIKASELISNRKFDEWRRRSEIYYKS
jgi:hypothetical protein